MTFNLFFFQINDLPRPSYMDQTPKELGIGSWGNVLSIHVNTPLHDALDIFLKNRVSALPLVDEEGRVSEFSFFSSEN